MKLQTKILTFLFLMLALLGLPMFIAGYMVISQIVYQLNEALFSHELKMLHTEVARSYQTLEYAGVLSVPGYVERSQNALLKKMQAHSFGESGRVYVFNSKKHMLLHKDLKKEEIMENLYFIDEMIQNKNGKISYQYNGTQRFCVYVYYPNWDWFIALSIDEAEIFAARQFYLKIVMIVSLSVFFTVWLLSSLFALRTSKKINTTLNCLKQIEEGDMTARIAHPGKDEVGIIQHGINAMIEKNAELYQTLEQKVEQRTTELAQANREITSLNKRLKAENTRMGAELEITRRLQQMVLPTTQELKNIKELDIACFMEPATEVGGDYCDVLEHNGHIKIGIGDVTGHGLESGVLMLMVQMAVRTLLANNVTDPKTFLSVLNRALFDNVRRMNSDKNLTLALLDYYAGKLYVSGQHEEILIIRQGGTVERVDTVNLGFMVGLEPDIRNFINRHEVQLAPGEGIVLYTDGITEARNTLGEMYGIERLCYVIAGNWQLSSEAIRDVIVHSIYQHIGNHPPADDITLLVIKQNSSI